MANENTLSLGSEFFADLREKFDAQLAQAILKMQSYGIEEGSVTLKVRIDLTTTPTFEYDIKSSIPVKDKMGGYARRENTHIEWNREAAVWTLEPDGPSLFDTER